MGTRALGLQNPTRPAPTPRPKPQPRPAPPRAPAPPPAPRPADGWRVGEKVEVLEELEGKWPAPMHPEEEWPWRFAFEGLREGMVVDGIVSDVWLYHGAQVDFVCEWDGWAAGWFVGRGRARTAGGASGTGGQLVGFWGRGGRERPGPVKPEADSER